MARPRISRSQSVERRALKATALINANVPKMKAYRMAGISHTAYYFRVERASRSEHAFRYGQTNDAQIQ